MSRRPAVKSDSAFKRKLAMSPEEREAYNKAMDAARARINELLGFFDKWTTHMLKPLPGQAPIGSTEAQRLAAKVRSVAKKIRSGKIRLRLVSPEQVATDILLQLPPQALRWITDLGTPAGLAEAAAIKARDPKAITFPLPRDKRDLVQCGYG